MGGAWSSLERARAGRYTLESLGAIHRSEAMITISDKGAEKVHEFLAAQEADLSVIIEIGRAHV